MYVCICQSVTDRDIRRAAEQGAASLDDLRDELGVSAFCGCCAPVARSVLETCTDAAGGQSARTAPPGPSHRGEPVVVRGEGVVVDAGWFTSSAPSTA